MPLTSYKKLIPDKWNSETYSLYLEKLLKLRDKKYKEFSRKITPTDYEIIGIRIPILRKIAKEIKDTNISEYFKNVKNYYLEETIITGILLSYIKDYNLFTKYFNKYIKCIDNWASCDTTISSCKIIKDNKDLFIKEIDNYLNSDNPYIIRVGYVSLLNYYIEDKYKDYIYEKVDNNKNDDYYVEMAIAWLLSYMFIKYRTTTINYLKNNNLSTFTQNKTISKIRDSLKVSIRDKDLILKYKKK